MIRRAALQVSLCIALAASSALADPAAVTQADALFAEGKAAMHKKQYDTACARFEASQRLDPGAGTLRWLAMCEEKRGKFVAASRHLQAAVALRPAADLLAEIDAQRAALERAAPRLRIKASVLDPSTSVALDGVELTNSQLNLPIIVDPGQHVVQVKRGAGSGQPTTASATPGQIVDVDLPAPVPGGSRGAAPPTSPATAPGPTARYTGYYVGMALAGAAVATYTGIKLSAARGEIASCKPRCTDEQQADADSARGLLPFYYGGVVVGALGVGLLTHAWLTRPGKTQPTASVSLRVGLGALDVKGSF